MGRQGEIGPKGFPGLKGPKDEPGDKGEPGEQVRLIDIFLSREHLNCSLR